MSCFVRDVDAAGDVVEQQHVAAGEQPAADQHLLLVAARERADLLHARPPRPDLEALDDPPRRAATRARRRRTPRAETRGEDRERQVVAHRTSAAAGPRSCGPRGRARCRGRRGSRRRACGSACACPPTRISPPVAFARAEQRHEELALALAGEAADAEDLAAAQLERDAVHARRRAGRAPRAPPAASSGTGGRSG